MTHRFPARQALHRRSSALAIGVVVAAPLLLGSVHTLSLLALSLASIVALWLAAVAGPVRIGVLPVVLCGLALWPAAQMIPLPPGLLEVVAPQTIAVAQDALGPNAGWRPITLDLPATARELVRALGLAALFAVLRHHSTSAGFRRRLLASLAGTGVLIAASAFLHPALGLDALLGWWRPTVEQRLPLPFGNANHAAGILNAAALLSLGIAASPRTPRPSLWMVGSILAFAASMALGARGGLVAGAVGLTVATGALLVHGNAFRVLAVVLPSVVVVGAVVLTLTPHLREEAESMTSLAVLEEGKFVPVRAAVAAFREQPWTGIGRGAFEVGHPRHLPEPASVTFTHVENEAVHALVELGAPVGIALVLCLLAAIALLARSARRSATEVGALAAAVALLVQSFGDFGLHFAGGFWLIALLATPVAVAPIATRVSSMVLVSTTAIALVASSLALPDLIASTRSLEALAADRSRSFDDVESAITAASRLRPADHVPPLIGAARALRDGRPLRSLEWANRALLLHPHSGNAHRLAGEAFAALQRRDEALVQFRLAMERGVTTTNDVLRHFPDSEAVLAATPSTPRAAFDAAWALFKAARYEDGLAILDRARTGDSPQVHYIRGILALRAERFEEAAMSARRLRELVPTSPDGWLIQATALQRQGRLEEARTTLASARTTAPPNARIDVELARVDLAIGAVDDAWRTLETMTPTNDAWLHSERRALRSQIQEHRKNQQRLSPR